MLFVVLLGCPFLPRAQRTDDLRPQPALSIADPVFGDGRCLRFQEVQATDREAFVSVDNWNDDCEDATATETLAYAWDLETRALRAVVLPDLFTPAGAYYLSEDNTEILDESGALRTTLPSGNYPIFDATGTRVLEVVNGRGTVKSLLGDASAEFEVASIVRGSWTPDGCIATYTPDSRLGVDCGDGLVGAPISPPSAGDFYSVVGSARYVLAFGDGSSSVLDRTTGVVQTYGPGWVAAWSDADRSALFIESSSAFRANLATGTAQAFEFFGGVSTPFSLGGGAYAYQGTSDLFYLAPGALQGESVAFLAGSRTGIEGALVYTEDAGPVSRLDADGSVTELVAYPMDAVQRVLALADGTILVADAAAGALDAIDPDTGEVLAHTPLPF